MNIKKAISQQRSSARKTIASIKLKPLSSNGERVMSNERAFLKLDFKNVTSVEELLSLVHKVRHNGLTKAGKYTRCKLCKKIAEEVQEIADFLPKIGNLLHVLEQEVLNEKASVEAKNVPSQGDLVRWALKDAVLAYYQGISYPDDQSIVESRYDDRLVDALAPDYSVIYKIFLQKLDDLKRRDDKYTLLPAEYDNAEQDVVGDKMQGSAFEKRLDRYRKEWMAKLPR